MTTAVKYRVLTIAGVAREFDTHVLKLADIVREWADEKERKVRREQRYLDKYAGPHLSRENSRLPVFKQVLPSFKKGTRKSRSSRNRALSRKQKRELKNYQSRDSRDDVDFAEAEEVNI